MTAPLVAVALPEDDERSKTDGFSGDLCREQISHPLGLVSKHSRRSMARKANGYRCEATTVGGFIQQLAVCYVRNRYLFYVMGHLREGADARAVDAKIIDKYRIDISKAERYRRKQSGRANLQYLRHGRTYLILATYGVGRFFDDEAKAIRSCERVAIKFGGYAVSFADGKARVRIEEERFKALKAYFAGIAVKRPASVIAEELWTQPFEPYAPVRFQLFEILRLVNRLRKAAALGPVPQSAIRKKRRIYRPFEPEGEGSEVIPARREGPLLSSPPSARPGDASSPPIAPQGTGPP